MSQENIVLTDEEKEKLGIQWENYVRSELNALLDIFLHNAVAGNIGIKYANPVIESYENGTKKVDDKKAVGVSIHINFKFGNDIDIPEES